MTINSAHQPSFIQNDAPVNSAIAKTSAPVASFVAR